MTHELLLEVPSYMAMISEILFSCWGACTERDPKAVEGAPSFRASAIIANPVTYGSIHCAEALGIPLHLSFPQPWVPTKYNPFS